MDQFMAMIVLFAGNFAPKGWAYCWNQLLSIAQNSALFSLIGTTYGGDGQTTFALPDLRGRFPLGAGQGPGLPNISLGQMSGTPSTTLLVTNMPAHSHVATLTSASVSPAATAALGTTHIPGPTVAPSQLPTLGGGPSSQPINGYGTPDHTTFLAPTNINGTVTIGVAGGNQPFSIMNPYIGMNYIIATQGIFPSRN